MKNLVLIRHAKSSWADPLLEDKERPLKKRGKRDAIAMGRRLFEKGIAPDLIISSPAVRALKTARKIAREINYPKAKIVIDETLYFQGEQAMFNMIAGLKGDTVFFIGHNPDLTDLANRLTNAQFESIPTCGVVSIELSSWQQDSGVVLFFDRPIKPQQC